MQKMRPWILLLIWVGAVLVTGCQTSSTSSSSTGTTTGSTGSSSGVSSGSSTGTTVATTPTTGDTGGLSDLDGNVVTTDGTGQGSSAEIMLGLLAKGVISRGSKKFDGRLNFTQYGGPTDGTPDKYTQAGLGNRNNKLRATSLALSPDLIRKYGLRGGERISIKTAKGTFFIGHYDDTTGNQREPNVIDVYDPGDKLGNDNFLATLPAGQWELVIGAQEK